MLPIVEGDGFEGSHLINAVAPRAVAAIALAVFALKMSETREL